MERTYRHWIGDGDLVSFRVAVKETDLYVRAQSRLEADAREAIARYRMLLERYIERHSDFQTAIEPIAISDDAPPIVREMAEAAQRAGVGPMAAVAGAMAEAVGRDLMPLSAEMIVENGGDIFMASRSSRKVGIYAGESPFTGNLALQIEPEETPLGICTSSGTVGHSLSLGEADAVIVLSPSTALADAAATAIGNVVRHVDDIQGGIDLAQGVDGLTGVVVIKGDHMGVWGQLKFAEPAEVECGRG